MLRTPGKSRDRRGSADPRKAGCFSRSIRFEGQIMKKKRFASSASARRAARNPRPMPDSRIDFSDIPESSTQELRRARRVGRPKSAFAKQLIAIRIDPRLLVRLRELARHREIPYQTLIHELLEKAAKREVA